MCLLALMRVTIVQMIDSPEVEKEVKRLLRADTFAVNVSILANGCIIYSPHKSEVVGTNHL